MVTRKAEYVNKNLHGKCRKYTAKSERNFL